MRLQALLCWTEFNQLIKETKKYSQANSQPLSPITGREGCGEDSLQKYLTKNSLISQKGKYKIILFHFI